MNGNLREFLAAYFGDCSVEAGIDDYLATFADDREQLAQQSILLHTAASRLRDADVALLHALQELVFPDLASCDSAALRLGYLANRLDERIALLANVES